MGGGKWECFFVRVVDMLMVWFYISGDFQLIQFRTVVAIHLYCELVCVCVYMYVTY